MAGVDATALERRLRDLSVELCDRLAEGVVEGARSRCSRSSGTLADSIEATPALESGAGATSTVEVGADYARYQDEGTGIYGPTGSRIEGKPLLAFDWPAAGGLVIVHSTAGAPGTHFWTTTIADWANIVRAVGG